MKCAMLCIVGLTLLQVAAGGQTASPVEKVVNLLKDLKAGIMEDGYKEGQLYNKTACWCDAMTKKKAIAIKDQGTELRMLGQEILRLKGKAATLTSEINELTADIKANEDSQAEATELRQKQNGAWQAETKEMKEAIAALQEAMHALVEGSGGKMSESELIQ